MKYKTRKLIPLLSSVFLTLAIIGLGFLVKQVIQPEPVIALAENFSDYLYQTENTSDFKAKFGHKDKLQEIVFEKDNTSIKIFVPIDAQSGNIKWKMIDDRLEMENSDGQSEYYYSILKDSQSKKPIGIKEDIVLNKKPTKKSFEFPIQLQGLTPRRVNGLWRFFDKNGLEKFFIPKPFMDDAQGAHSDDVDIQIEGQGEEYLIRITPSQEWLTHPDRVYPVIVDPSLQTDSHPIAELQEKRTLNAKFFNNKDGTQIMQAYAGYVHYMDKYSRQFEDVDTTLWPTDNGWEMHKAGYELEIPQYADQWFKFINSAQINYETGEDFMVPDEEIHLRPLGVKNVKGELITNAQDPWHHKKILYKNAYNQNIDLEFVAQDNSFDKLVVINEKPADLSKDLEFSFELDFSEETEIKIKTDDGFEIWTEETPLTISGSLIVEKLRKTWFSSFKVWDSQGNQKDIKARLEKKGNKYFLTKIIDKEFLKNAVYPVITDATVEQHYTDCAGGDDIGTVSHTGDGTPQAWANIHNALTGTAVSACSGTGNYVQAKYVGGGSKIADVGRAFIPIDTSGLPDDANISAATLNIYVNALVGDSTYNVVQTTQPDVTALTTADYDLCGSTHTPTLGAAAVTPQAANWAVFTLNATGRGWIDVAGYTKLGIRDVEHDITDAVPVNNENNKMDFDDDTTANDPYLEITYSIGNPASPVSGTGITEILIKGGINIKGGIRFR